MSFVAACMMAVLTCAMMSGNALAAETKESQKTPPKAPPKKAPLYKIRKPDNRSTYGTYYPLCQEVLKIVNLPENEDFRLAPEIGDFSQGGTFYIPLDRFKNFSLPTWEEIPKEQWTKYVDLDFIAEWERPNGPIVQMRKTMVDIDHDGNKDEMIDFSSDVRVNDPNFRNPARSCTLSKNAAPYLLSKSGGLFRVPEVSRTLDNCFIFQYSSRAYVADRPGLLVKEISSNYRSKVVSQYVCSLNYID